MTYYDSLGLDKSCSQEAVKKRYAYLVTIYNPDVYPDQAVAQKKLLERNEAYSILGDARRREKYDFHLAQQERLSLAADMGGTAAVSSDDSIRMLQTEDASISEKKQTTIRRIIYYIIVFNLIAVLYFLLKYFADIGSGALSYLMKNHAGWILLLLLGLMFIVVTLIMNRYMRSEEI